MRIQIDVAVDFFYGGRDSYLVRRAECEFRVQRCRISSQQTNRTIVLQYVVNKLLESKQKILIIFIVIATQILRGRTYYLCICYFT